MTREEAIKILDVNNTSAKELEMIKNYKGFNGREAIFMALKDACLMAVAAFREQEERRWIPVEDRLPGKYQTVVGGCKDNPFSKYTEAIVCWNGKGWVFLYAQRYVTNVTHWMPLPEPPKEE